jgi:hypothetical protein
VVEWKRIQWALDLLLTRDEDNVVFGLDDLAQQVHARAWRPGIVLAVVPQPVRRSRSGGERQAGGRTARAVGAALMTDAPYWRRSACTLHNPLTFGLRPPGGAPLRPQRGR